jgi:hypothetical protein
VTGPGGVLRRFDGAGWATLDVAGMHFHGVWGLDAQSVWVGTLRQFVVPDDEDGEDVTECAIQRIDPLTGAFSPERENAFLRDSGSCGIVNFHGRGPTEVWAVGHSAPMGALDHNAITLRRTAAGWERSTATYQQQRGANDVVVGIPGEPATVYFAGEPSVVFAGGWTNPETPPLMAIDARGAWMYAISEGRVLRWDAGAWVVE